MPLQSPFARQVLFFQFLVDFVDHTFVHFLPPRFIRFSMAIIAVYRIVRSSQSIVANNDKNIYSGLSNDK
ncbi:hypothetical protein SDC9_96376 [bioreactor metagenome]|uniref:Uncharacterized protein n=1 Tax=bioreactor metagenome TaxID=1076179 RepID=A0A645A9R9_9ZZZZ